MIYYIDSLCFFFSIAVPPKQPVILDEDMKERDGVAGPSTEGSSLTLHCHVFGGKKKNRFHFTNCLQYLLLWLLWQSWWYFFEKSGLSPEIEHDKQTKKMLEKFKRDKKKLVMYNNSLFCMCSCTHFFICILLLRNEIS